MKTRKNYQAAYEGLKESYKQFQEFLRNTRIEDNIKAPFLELELGGNPVEGVSSLSELFAKYGDRLVSTFSKGDIQDEETKSPVEIKALEYFYKKIELDLDRKKNGLIEHALENDWLQNLIKLLGEGENIKQKEFDSLLLRATECGSNKIAEHLLLECEANPFQQSIVGETAFSAAVSRQNTFLIQKYLPQESEYSKMLSFASSIKEYYEKLAKILTEEEKLIEREDGSILGFTEHSLNACVIGVNEVYSEKLGGSSDIWAESYDG